MRSNCKRVRPRNYGGIAEREHNGVARSLGRRCRECLVVPFEKRAAWSDAAGCEQGCRHSSPDAMSISPHSGPFPCEVVF